MKIGKLEQLSELFLLNQSTFTTNTVQSYIHTTMIESSANSLILTQSNNSELLHTF